MQIDRLGPDDVGRVLAAGALFDDAPRREWAEDFLARSGHHLLMARVDDVDVGFVSGIEITHPDKGVEMLLYELGVDEEYRRRGIGRALTLALADLARELGCRGMWVPTEPDNEPAIATYRSAGAEGPDQAVILSWDFT
jgi:ribosomal protein S18 acetylase RimI-like enzyme